MIQVGAYEAKTHLSNLLKKVYDGEEVMITKHHVPIAKIIPVSPKTRQSKSTIISDLKKFRKGRTLQDASIAELITDGRK